MSDSDSSDWEAVEDDEEVEDQTALEVLSEFQRGRIRKAKFVQKRRIAVRHRPGPKGPNKDPRPFSWEDHVSDMNEVEFKKRYRLSTEAFDQLVGIIGKWLSATDVDQSQRAELEPRVHRVRFRGTISFVCFSYFY